MHPTGSESVKRKINVLPTIFCSVNMESCIHLFVGCPVAQNLWFSVLGLRVDMRNVNSLPQLLKLLVWWNDQLLPAFNFLFEALLLMDYIWFSWNQVKFNGVKWNMQDVVDEILARIYFYLSLPCVLPCLKAGR